MTEDLKQYSGEEHYRKPPRLNLPTISLDGNKGLFYKSYQENNEWVKEEVGKGLKGIILRVRRSLVSMTDEERMYTNEHNHPGEVVTLFLATKGGGQQIATGNSQDLRGKFQKLKTHQIVYMLVNNELVKVRVKGSSLGSKNKPEDSVGLYEYYDKFSSDEHLYEFETIITPREEKGKLGVYYAMSFEKGEKHNQIDEVSQKLKELHNVFISQESYYTKPIEGKAPIEEKVPTLEEEKSMNEFGEEEIKVEDLPF